MQDEGYGWEARNIQMERQIWIGVRWWIWMDVADMDEGWGDMSNFLK